MYEMIHGNCLNVKRYLARNSVDAIVCDPPYGLGFMGKSWDHGVPGPRFWRRLLRVAKPGAYLVAFGGTRTYHRLMVAIEDAGWEIRDCFSWMYGTGFPKSLNISKAIDKKLGGKRKVVGQYRTPGGGKVLTTYHNFSDKKMHEGKQKRHVPVVSEAGTDEAAKWEGWGTALKPAWEPIVIARKPFDGTLTDNVLEHGTGGMNIDSTRLGAGRWPSNVLLDRIAADMLDEQQDVSRFFYVTKASRRERDQGCKDLPMRTGGEATGRKDGSAGTRSPRAGAGRTSGARNDHPTVKPVALMRWLVRLVTPPDGIVLDPFTGSGSTGVAALKEGFAFIGIEKSKHYTKIAKARLADADA